MSQARQLGLDFNVPQTSPHALLESSLGRIHRKLKPRTHVPTIETEFFPSVGANHTATLKGRTLRVRISDLFEDAPEHVFEALAEILLSKIYGKKVDPKVNLEYRRYTMSEDMLERSRRARATRGRKPSTTGATGRCYDLSRFFDEINADNFGSSLQKPELSWTTRKTRSVLGRYDFDQDVIFLSRSLDTPQVPEYVVRYVLFHEMLHVKHGSRVQNLRAIVHTPDFRREERKFEFYDAANRWLKSPSSMQPPAMRRRG